MSSSVSGRSESELDWQMDLTDTLVNGVTHRDGPSDSEADEADLITSASKSKAKSDSLSQKNGKQRAFASLGVSATLTKCLGLRGFNVPTPIQRQAIPFILDSPPRDVVAMARTGSGKTLAYMIPLIQRLGGGIHSNTYGTKAVILVPTRELALQVLKVGKDLARGGAAKDTIRQESLRWALVVGGEGLDAQFSTLADNPDVIIATPGRLLHLTVEMNLDLRSVQYVVFDEADRLFELGFSLQLHEILSRLPSTRQTLLFSATLPKTCVEFAKAGLQNPKLVRLDADSKISTDLRMSFLSIKQVDKEAALLCLVRDVIKVPIKAPDKANDGPIEARGKKRKREATHELKPHQTLVFTATKHHVEYLTLLLSNAGYAVSQIYSSLDQTNRKMQLDNFRNGKTDILVVTDLAARGIDIPLLANVVNYDFPVGAKSFIHRVGRTARAGRTGWAHSFITSHDLPFLFDLHLFLSRPIISCPTDCDAASNDFANNLIIGQFPQEMLDNEIEHVRSVLFANAPSLDALQATSIKGQKMYERSSVKASPESYRRAKEFVKDSDGLAGANGDASAVHPIFFLADPNTRAAQAKALARSQLIDKIKAFTPQETVFEIGSKGNISAALLMKDRRKAVSKKAKLAQAAAQREEDESEDDLGGDGLVAPHTKRFEDDSFYLGYVQEGAATEKGYNMTEGTSFVAEAAQYGFGLGNDDDGNQEQLQRASTLRWDRKNKRIVQGTGIGADNKKLIKTESGTRLPASFRSGKFEEWKQKHRTSLPRVGDIEKQSAGPRKGSMGSGAASRWRHKSGTPGEAKASADTKGRGKQRSSMAKASLSKKPSNGLRNYDQIAKERKLKAARVRRSNQPSKKKKR